MVMRKFHSQHGVLAFFCKQIANALQHVLIVVQALHTSLLIIMQPLQG